ncbi:FadR/GntR family transcriptional regulator [Allopusillimonas ginsengisoli]|uniref:FadR/GntR family transcriptional regulator n=1 Tax=Allopusillimonas ginsengisoli TaxID=453575 RepID=UPI001021690A|nr:FadR/GntR family transcriptional regulator [Allopusillimonas ginsengisoli]TEA77945.1 FadR family transcriptional regulator [Allopusillimonas ginsengisoli]
MKSGSLLRGTDRTRSYLHTAELLRQEIRKMDIDVSGRLPSERELAALLDISRPSLREALIALELQGEIDIRVGSGIYLRQTSAANGANDNRLDKAGNENIDAASPLRLGDSPREVNQLRGFLEGGIAAHAARFISPVQLRQLKKSLDAMRAALTKKHSVNTKAIIDADRSFHLTLATSTDNELLMQTLEDLFDQRYLPVAKTMHKHFDDHVAWQAAVEEHQDIYEAVAAKDPLQAQAAMQRHLARAHARLLAMIG